MGEPITVPKIEAPSADVVDLYHAMYIKSLQCLFDKYKTRFGLKESDILYIQWKAEGVGGLLKLWTVAAFSDPGAPYPSPVQSWCLAGTAHSTHEHIF